MQQSERRLSLAPSRLLCIRGESSDVHVMAVARRHGDVSYLRATRRQPALVLKNSYCRGGLPDHTFAPELSNTRSTSLLVGWTARGSINLMRGREGGRAAAAATAATTGVRHQSRQSTNFPMGMHQHPMGPFLEGPFGKRSLNLL